MLCMLCCKKENVTLQAANGNLPVCLLHCENGHTCTKSRSGPVKLCEEQADAPIWYSGNDELRKGSFDLS